MFMKKKATKEERLYMSRVAMLGCMICGNSQVEIHHKTGTGMGLRASHADIMPLCVNHHRGQNGIHTMGRRAWEREFKTTQQELIDKTKDMLDEG